MCRRHFRKLRLGLAAAIISLASVHGQPIGQARATGTRVAPPADSTASTLRVALEPAIVTAGSSARGTIKLQSAAPSGGLVVTVRSSDPNVVQVPPSVLVPSGASSTIFAVQTIKVSQQSTVDISVQVGSSQPVMARLVVGPASPGGQGGAAPSWDLKSNQMK